MQLHRSYADACKQQEKNKEWQAVTEYCTAHEDKVYFIDVYSAVPYSEGQYTMQAEPENYVLLGGWLTQSPALADKLERLGMNPAAEGLLRGNGYFICRDNRPLDWITGYYASIGRRVVISEKDRLTVNKDCTFIIYQISQSDADA